MEVRPGQVLWEPSAARMEGSRVTAFMRWLARERGCSFASYGELWRWSVDDLEGFWGAVHAYFEVRSTPHRAVLADPRMPGARWFEGARINYAEHALRTLQPDAPALIYQSELRPLGIMTGAELDRRVRAVAAGLAELGVGPGDRVAAYVPNIPEAVVAFLAAASLGAVWSSCSPDFGASSVIDRFRQIEPKVLLTIDGYRYGGKELDRRAEAGALQAALPSVTHVFEVAYLHPGSAPRPGTRSFRELYDRPDAPPPRFAEVPFDHPLWVLYSSGTTGLPKAIVHGHGGILLEHLKVLAFHGEIARGDRLFWFTTTGWMMWNYIVSGLLHGAAVVLYDGNPGYPDLDTLWKLAEEAQVTYFGTSAAYVGACLKAGLEPRSRRDLSRLRGFGSTGSPLSPEGFAWVYEAVGPDVWLNSISGGTDVCSGFVGGTVHLPVRAGEIQTACLGAAVESWDEQGRPVIGQVGELVLTKPLPSMPVFFWGDPSGERYRKAYFDVWPGVWRHGDFAEIGPHGGIVIRGRSDSTLNRYGVRIGTAEIYRAVESMPEIREALVVNLEKADGELFMPLFVSLAEGVSLDQDLERRIAARLRTECSPRHVPDAIHAVDAIPKTLNGKKMEIPVRLVLSGRPVESVASKDACQNPEALEAFVHLAERLLPTRG